MDNYTYRVIVENDKTDEDFSIGADEEVTTGDVFITDGVYYSVKDVHFSDNISYLFVRDVSRFVKKKPLVSSY